VCAEALSSLFDAPAMVLIEEDGVLRLRAQAGGTAPGPYDQSAAEWALAARLPARGGAYPHTKAAYDVWPVLGAQRQGAVIGLAISGREEGRPKEPEQLTEVVGAYLAVALDRQAYAAQVLQAQVEAAGERLKTDLLAAVSHDLKTPLSTVLFTLQSLDRFDHEPEDRAALVRLAEAEAERLARLVDDLLDTNRLEAGAASVRPAVADPAELVEGALAQAERALEGHAVERALPARARPLLVDAALFENALAKVLENAGRHTPRGGTVRILAGDDGAMGWIEVRDEGQGFPGAPESYFEKFVRGVPGDGRPPGLGLGLALARGFLTAMGGRIEAGGRTDGPGAWVRLSAPLAKAAEAA
jgi:two-component system sensor histidine kinase KdpD